MKFLHHLFSSNKLTGLDKIEGYEDIKDIVMRVLDSEDNYADTDRYGTGTGHVTNNLDAGLVSCLDLEVTL